MPNETGYIIGIENVPATMDEASKLLQTDDLGPTATSCGSTNGMLTPPSENEASQPLGVPSWFLNGCVKTLEELKSCEIPLRIHDSLNGKDDLAITEAENTDHYEIHTAIYESLFHLVAPQEESEDSIQQRKFAYDAMGVRLPHEEHGQHFLGLVMQHFAKDIGADIITLGYHDLENLAVHFATESGHTLPEGVTALGDVYFVEPEKPSKESPPKARKKLPFPFDTMFASISQKRGLSHTTDQKQEERPIIVLLTEVQKNFYASPRHLMTHLRDYVKNARAQGREIAVIAIDSQCDPVYGYPWTNYPSEDNEFLADLGSNPIKTVQVVVPMKSDAQKQLLEKDFKKTEQKRAIRELQELVRARRAVPSFSGFLEPYVDWKVSETSFAAKRLEEADFGGRELELLSSALSTTDLDVANVEKVFERFGVLNEWMEETKEEEKPSRRWDNLHEGARKAIKKVEGSLKYEFEQNLLESIVSSGEYLELIPFKVLSSKLTKV